MTVGQSDLRRRHSRQLARSRRTAQVTMNPHRITNAATKMPKTMANADAITLARRARHCPGVSQLVDGGPDPAHRDPLAPQPAQDDADRPAVRVTRVLDHPGSARRRRREQHAQRPSGERGREHLTGPRGRQAIRRAQGQARRAVEVVILGDERGERSVERLVGRLVPHDRDVGEVDLQALLRKPGVHREDQLVLHLRGDREPD